MDQVGPGGGQGSARAASTDHRAFDDARALGGLHVDADVEDHPVLDQDGGILELDAWGDDDALTAHDEHLTVGGRAREVQQG